MNTPIPSFARAPLSFAVAAFACLSLAASHTAKAQAATASGFATLQGFVIDSVHNTPLAGAVVMVDGTTRHGITTSEGRYLIDSIPPGSRRVALSHPLLDTIGLSMASPPITLSAARCRTSPRKRRPR